MTEPDTEPTEQDEAADIVEPNTGELVHVTDTPPLPARRDLRNEATDSWTSVLVDVAELSNRIAGTPFVPEAYRGSPAATAATILHGRELGLPPMSALAMTNPIKGRPSLSAEGMRALVQQAGHQIKIVETTSNRCVMRGRRSEDAAVDGDWTTAEWTMDDARRAGLLRKSQSGKPSNWETYPADMLVARATTRLCRLIFSDVIHGLRSSEELEDMITAETPAPQTQPPAGPTTTVQRTRRGASKRQQPAPVQAPQEQQEAKPERQRPPIPTRGQQEAAPKTGEPGRTAGTEDPAPPATSARPRGRPAEEPAGESNSPDDPDPAGSSATHIEAQQAEVRRMSEERRNLAAAASNQEPKPDTADDTDTEDAEVVTGRETGPKLSAGQRATIMMHFNRLDVDDRDERLWWTNRLAGLGDNTVKSSNELRAGEATRLIQQLEQFRDRDQLDASINQDQLLNTEEGND